MAEDAAYGSPHASDDADIAPRRRTRIRSLLALMLLVNLAASLYQLPLNRVVERRLCREYYARQSPEAVPPDGSIDERLCKVDEVQQGLAWIQGVMETAWVVGGECSVVAGGMFLTPRKTSS